MAAFFNTTDNPVTIGKGDRVVQLCMPGLEYNFTVEVAKLSRGNRTNVELVKDLVQLECKKH